MAAVFALDVFLNFCLSTSFEKTLFFWGGGLGGTGWLMLAGFLSGHSGGRGWGVRVGGVGWGQKWHFLKKAK